MWMMSILITDSHSKAQQGLDIMSQWSMAWGMKVKIKKSQVVHHRNPQRKRHPIPLILRGAKMEYVTDYKYLGCWVNEFGSDAKTVDALSAGVGRSFGRIINIFRKLGDMGIKTYSTLYESYVLPVANYALAV